MANSMKKALGALSFITDSFKRAKMEREIVELANRLLVKEDAGLEFEGINFANPTPESATLLLILKNITTTHPKFSLVNFKGGVMLVRTEDVEKLKAEYQDVNEKANFIIRGGSEKAANLEVNIAKPTGSVTEE